MPRARAILHARGAFAATEIEAALSDATELIEATNHRLFEPRICLVRAELAAAQGDKAAREGHLREAHRLYTEMGATGHAERVGRELDSIE